MAANNQTLKPLAERAAWKQKLQAKMAATGKTRNEVLSSVSKKAGMNPYGMKNWQTKALAKTDTEVTPFDNTTGAEWKNNLHNRMIKTERSRDEVMDALESRSETNPDWLKAWEKKALRKSGRFEGRWRDDEEEEIEGGGGNSGTDRPSGGIGSYATDDPNSMAYRNRTDLVEDRLAGLMGKDSRLMEIARSDGRKYAESRGMLNSSIAAGASERAMIDSAMPIASQDSQQEFTKNLSAQDYLEGRDMENLTQKHRMDLADQAFGHNTALADQGFGFDTKLADQSFGFNTALSDQTFGQNTALAKQGFAYDFQLSNQAQKHRMEVADFDAELRTELAEIDVAARENIAGMEISANEKDAAIRAITSAQQMYSEDYRTIMNNDTLSAEDRIEHLEGIRELYKSRVAAVEGTSGMTFDWLKALYKADEEKAAEEKAAEDDDTEDEDEDDVVYDENGVVVYEGPEH